MDVVLKFVGSHSPVGRTLRSVQVVFRKLVEERCSYWEAVRGKRTVVPGTPWRWGVVTCRTT